MRSEIGGEEEQGVERAEWGKERERDLDTGRGEGRERERDLDTGRGGERESERGRRVPVP